MSSYEGLAPGFWVFFFFKPPGFVVDSLVWEWETTFLTFVFFF